MNQSKKTRFEYKIMTEKWTRKEIAIRMHQIINEIHQNNVSTVIFLDKSARPLNTLFLALWSLQFPDISHPKINFFNIGREITDTAYGYAMNSRLKTPMVNILEGSNIKDSENDLGDVLGHNQVNMIRQSYQYLNDLPSGSKIAVIDDWSQSGLTLDAAYQLLRVLFPGLDIQMYATQYGRLGSYGGASPWKGDQTGVMDKEDQDIINLQSSADTVSSRAYVIQLRREMHEMAKDYWETLGTKAS